MLMMVSEPVLDSAGRPPPNPEKRWLWDESGNTVVMFFLAISRAQQIAIKTHLLIRMPKESLVCTRCLNPVCQVWEGLIMYDSMNFWVRGVVETEVLALSGSFSLFTIVCDLSCLSLFKKKTLTTTYSLKLIFTICFHSLTWQLKAVAIAAFQAQLYCILYAIVPWNNLQ